MLDIFAVRIGNEYVRAMILLVFELVSQHGWWMEDYIDKRCSLGPSTARVASRHCDV